jgi:FtsZ-binding cell division protein ZapB
VAHAYQTSLGTGAGAHIFPSDYDIHHKDSGKCHADNQFAVQFSVDKETWTSWIGHPKMSDADAKKIGLKERQQCSVLDDGCGWEFDSLKIRYFRLRALSTCAGCINYDYISALKLRRSNSLSNLVNETAEDLASMKVVVVAAVKDVEAVEKRVDEVHDQTTASIDELQERNAALETTVDDLKAANVNLTDRTNALAATIKTLLQRMESLHSSFGTDIHVVVPEPKHPDPSSAGADGPPTIEAIAGGALKISIKPGSRITVNEDELLTRSEIQEMIQSTLAAVLAAAAAGSA